MAQPVQPSFHSLVPATWSGVMAEGAAIHARGECLSGGEVARLTLGDRGQLIMVDVMHMDDIGPHKRDPLEERAAPMANVSLPAKPRSDRDNNLAVDVSPRLEGDGLAGLLDRDGCGDPYSDHPLRGSRR